MTAGDQQHQIGKIERRFRGGDQSRGKRMRLQMVDGNKGYAARCGDGLGRHNADDNATDQPWPAGCRNGVQLAETGFGLPHRFRDDGIDRFQMGAGGDFRHDSAERRMIVDLRPDDLAENRVCSVLCIVNHRRRGFVAACLYAEDLHGRDITPSKIPNLFSFAPGRGRDFT